MKRILFKMKTTIMIHRYKTLKMTVIVILANLIILMLQIGLKEEVGKDFESPNPLKKIISFPNLLWSASQIRERNNKYHNLHD